MMKTSVIIPVFRGERYLPALLQAIAGQDLEDVEILIFETAPEGPCRKIAQDHGAQWTAVEKYDFDHAGTRTMAAQEAQGDVLIFLSQDVLPTTPDTFGTLIEGLREKSRIGAAYGRQIAPKCSRPWGTIKRGFIYPGTSHVREPSDAKQYGFQAAFLSNAFAAFRRQALEETGWFGERELMCEDVGAGARLLQGGWKIAYIAEAVVQHDHSTTLGIEARRYFDIGASHQRQRWMREFFGPPRPEGALFFGFGARYLWKTNRPYLLPSFAARSLIKLAAYRLGRAHHRLPQKLIPRLSGFPEWWTRNSCPCRRPQHMPTTSKAPPGQPQNMN